MLHTSPIRPQPRGWPWSLGILILIGGYAPESHPAAWDVKPTLGVGARYESNPRMQRRNERDALGTVVNAALDITAATGRTTVILKPKVRLNFYPDKADSDLENDDRYLDLLVEHETAQSVYGLAASYSDVSIRTSELADTGGPGAPPPGNDSGALLFVDQTRELWSVTPSWRYQLSARNVVLASASYSEVTFSKETEVTNLFDYKSSDAVLSLQHMLSEADSVSIELTAAGFKSETPSSGLVNETTSYGANASFTHAFSDTLDVTAQVGSEKSTFDVTGFFPDEATGNPLTDLNPFFPTPKFMCTDPPDQAFLPFNFVPCTRSDSDTNLLYGISLNKSTERANMNISLDRSIYPNSRGSTVVQDTLRFFWRQNFSARWSGTLSLNAYQQTDVGELTDRERDFFRADLTLQWQWTKRWYFRGRYAFVRDNQKDNIRAIFSNGSADNQLVYVGIEYRGLGLK